MNITFRRLSALLLLGVYVLGLGACNTIRGVGEDTEKAGEKIQQKSDEHRYNAVD